MNLSDFGLSFYVLSNFVGGFSKNQVRLDTVPKENVSNQKFLTNKLKTINVHFFSDTIIYWANGPPEKAIEEICLAVGYAMTFSLMGQLPFLLRGAISYDENCIVQKENFFVGKGIIKSYEHARILNSAGIFIPESPKIKEEWTEGLLKKKIIFQKELKTKLGLANLMMVNPLFPFSQNIENLNETYNTCEKSLNKLLNENRRDNADENPDAFYQIKEKLTNSKKLIHYAYERF
jgi:hypothetical protein